LSSSIRAASHSSRVPVMCFVNAHLQKFGNVPTHLLQV
jgi:hypothetical protein